ncbi:MAG: ribokinase [Tepidanaerobacteraceae bacterium]|nr:ribokinase [Tepidanaerobacteraceae bacterium]
MKITVIGSINMDYTSRVDKLPQMGETIMAASFYVSPGGKGANQAVAARRLGAKVAMVGCVGRDAAGRELVERFKSEGIDTSCIKYSEKPTGNALITVDEEGHNTIVVYGGSNGELDIDWVKACEKHLTGSDYVILQQEIPLETVEYAMKLCRDIGAKVILNPAPAKKLPADAYKYVDIITPNETELLKLTGKEDISEGAEVLLSYGAKSVVVTLGEKGCVYISKDERIVLEAFRVKAVDTTAAGDSFNAALAVALAEGKDIGEALKFSNAVGALTATKYGAQDSLPYRSDVDGFLRNH